ncbi:MAG: hypothetical protein EXX96DRAFT_559700 [Benjaminiella poitrasii]|nr:MAG: hypothetical protein EXX96DRAFT_559700 [Benjaminiella poitrasii]
MKFFSIYCYFLSSFVFISVFASCDCDANDNACVSQCVIDANSCVTSCKGNIACYQRCIDDKWPTESDTIQSASSTTTVTATRITIITIPTVATSSNTTFTESSAKISSQSSLALTNLCASFNLIVVCSLFAIYFLQ